MEGRKFQARADVIDGEDYERLYKQHADINPGFWDYRQKTSRKIPVVVLEPLDGDKPDLRGNTRRATE